MVVRGLLNERVVFMLKLRETHTAWGYLITAEIQVLVEHKSAAPLGVLSLVPQTGEPKGKGASTNAILK